MDFLNTALPKYVKIWFDDTKTPVKVWAVYAKMCSLLRTAFTL